MVWHSSYCGLAYDSFSIAARHTALVRVCRIWAVMSARTGDPRKICCKKQAWHPQRMLDTASRNQISNSGVSGLAPSQVCGGRVRPLRPIQQASEKILEGHSECDHPERESLQGKERWLSFNNLARQSQVLLSATLSLFEKRTRKMFKTLYMYSIIEPVHEISNNVAFWQVQSPVELRNSVSSLTIIETQRLAKALIRLRVCAGWSQALLVAHTTLLVISCPGSCIVYGSNGTSISDSPGSDMCSWRRHFHSSFIRSSTKLSFSLFSSFIFLKWSLSFSRLPLSLSKHLWNNEKSQ